MGAVLHEFFVWCVQFVVVSTVFLTTSYWLLARSRRLKSQKLAPSAMSQQFESKWQETDDVAHRS